MESDKNTAAVDGSRANVGAFSNHDPATTPEKSQAKYAGWRDKCPVAHSEAFDGFYLLNRYSDVRRAAKDWETFSSSRGVFQPTLPFRVRVIEADPPEHTRDRELLKEVLNVDTYRHFNGHVRDDVGRLIDGFVGDGRVELIAALCEPLPVYTISALIGLDADEARRVRPVAMMFFEASNDPALFASAEADFNALVAEVVATRRSSPRDDFVTRLATEPLGEKMLDDGEIVNLLTGFLIAGHHTTTSAMSSLFRHILEDSALKDRLIEEPDLIRRAVEEVLRLDTPLHMFGRTTTCPVAVEGVEIPEDSFVMLNWASANRDPEQFPDPSSFRLDRSPNPHLAFGYGIHTCVGAQLARMELEIATSELLTRIPDIEADGAAPSYRFSGGNLAVLPELRARFTPQPAG